MMEVLNWIGQHPVLSVVLLIVFFQGLSVLIRGL